MKRIFLLFIFLSCTLSAQITAEQEYQLLLEEVELINAFGSINNALLDSARAYAEREEYGIAVVFLEDIIHGFFPGKQEMLTKDKDPVKSMNQSYNGSFEIMFKTGVDYNRQEFELDFIETDSVLIDEVQKPFFGFESRLAIAGDPYVNGLSMQSDVQYDKENFRGDLELEHRLTKQRIEMSSKLGFGYDDNSIYKNLGFMELYGRNSLRWSISSSTDLQVRNSVRLKRYQTPSVTVPDFFREIGSVELIHTGNVRQFVISYDINYNESLQYKNNDFFEQTGSINLDGFLGPLFRNDLRLGYRNNHYNLALLEDSVLTNRSQTFFSAAYLKFSLLAGMAFEVDYAFNYKVYSDKTEQDPDYILNRVIAGLSGEINRDWSIRPAFLFESKTHRLQPDLLDIYIREQDYTGQGISLSMDYNRLQGLMISSQVSYSLRRYPQADPEQSLNLYSSRNVLTLFLFAQIPLTEHIHFNLLASYDNDRDKDSDNNDTRSSFYTVELQYRF